jgi:hypothetical protein
MRKTATIDSEDSLVKKFPRYSPLPSEEREKGFRMQETGDRRQKTESKSLSYFGQLI